MKSTTREAHLLKSATAIVEDFVGHHTPSRRQEARFQLLEAVGSRLGGFDLQAYQNAFKVKPVATAEHVLATARAVVKAINSSGIPPALAVSALAREALDEANMKRSGAYHTDFRLAQHLAATVSNRLKAGIKIVDPACGAGILLTAVTMAACGADRQFASQWLAESVFAADLSENALRGTLIALSCLTDDVPALCKMRSKWRVQDSLLAGAESWRPAARKGFDLVVANPPWEKVKVSRHEFIRSEGGARHYGADYDKFDTRKYEVKRAQADSYGAQLVALYPSLGSGEPDLYVAFSELLLQLAKPGGAVALLLPAGLIRSQGTQRLREELLKQSSEIAIQILDNRARFFEIDTRFKFLLVSASKRVGSARQEPIHLSSAQGTSTSVELSSTVRIGRAALAKLRPDLSIPEIRSDAEWKLFLRMTEAGHDWSAPGSPWHPEFAREVDMTRERPLFLTIKRARALPVVEGRMVHQHRFGAKTYVGGTGRSANWTVNVPGASHVAPQFYIDPGVLSAKAAMRARQLRVGFCDITGQTNERSCLAAIIPSGVVCGNKVPTVMFPNDPHEDRLWLWVALVNSLPFDWMVRRVITTTINYFHLLSLPLPPIEPDSLPGRKLVEIARALAALDRAGASNETHWRVAELRAKADQLVLNAFGLDADDLHLILQDFPLVDRAQPALPGERQSTITRDMILALSRLNSVAAQARQRVEAAAAIGALPYLPSQMALAAGSDKEEEMAHG
jgi:methylase of polypeptide subunit release factors